MAVILCPKESLPRGNLYRGCVYTGPDRSRSQPNRIGPASVYEEPFGADPITWICLEPVRHGSKSNRGHTSLRQLSDGFSLHLTKQNTRTVRGRSINCSKANMALDISASPNPSPPLPTKVLMIGQLKRKPPEGCKQFLKN